MLQEARSKGIEIADADIDKAYATMAGNLRMSPPRSNDGLDERRIPGRARMMTPQQLSDLLVQAGIDPGTLRDRIRADLARYALRRVVK